MRGDIILCTKVHEKVKDILEGIVGEGDHVVIVEDEVTTGRTIVNAVRALMIPKFELY